MQFETTNSICALCKSALTASADAYPGPSRLCRACQQLVQTMLPRAGLTAARETAPAMDALFDTAVVVETVYADDPEDILSGGNGADYRKELKHLESDFFRPEEESYYKTELEIQPDPDEIEDFVEDFPGAPHQSLADDVDDLSEQVSIDFSPSDSAGNAETVSPVAQYPVGQYPVAQDEASSYDTEPAPETWQNVTQIYGAQPAPEYYPPITAPLTGEPSHENARNDVISDAVETNTVETNSVETNTVVAQAQGYEEAATDPWDNPLPAWDYSETEYPVLLGSKRGVNIKPLTLVIAAGLLIVGFIAGYFILSQPDSSQNGSQPPVAESNVDLAAPDAKDDSHGIAAEQQNVLPQASADTNPAQATKPADSTEFGSAGALTLQSAAFPDEAGASEFSLKLIRAGIPAYVVPADLPRKGRWFRVRVGRFTNADDAKKYATQSRLRAKAAGMDLDFIVVEYGKP